MRRAQNHFVDGTARRNHGKNVLERRDFDVQEIWAGFRDSLFESLPGFLCSVNCPALESVRSSELLGIRKRSELDMTQPVVIEKLLPLAHHAEMAVVHNDDLDGE